MLASLVGCAGVEHCKSTNSGFPTQMTMNGIEFNGLDVKESFQTCFDYKMQENSIGDTNIDIYSAVRHTAGKGD